MEHTIQLLDPYGNYRTQTDCGSGEGGGCDSYNEVPSWLNGDWGGETYLPDDTQHILPVRPGQQPKILGVTVGTWLVVGFALVVLRGATR